MGVECDIILDSNADCVIQCGETIHGTLIVRSQSSFAPTGLCVQLRGRGRVSYREFGDNYDGYEGYFSPEEHISSKELQLSTGGNQFKFHLTVPEHFPPTFTYATHVGYIIYKLTAYLDNDDSRKKIGVLPVTVQGKLDLRTDPAYRMPVSVKEDKTFLFSKHGLELLLSIPQSGFAIGQSIPFSVLVRNDSTVDCSDSKIYLVQYIDYINTIGAVRRNTGENIVQKRSLGPILKHSNKKFDDSIDIPTNVCITTQDRSKVVKVYYKLRLVAVVTGPHLNGKLECPVTIGSIPLDEKCEKVKC